MSKPNYNKKNDRTTLNIQVSTAEKIKNHKITQRESYDEILMRLLEKIEKYEL